MADIINANTYLYPPIIDTYMPAFILGNTCRVYFSISAYNKIEDIAFAQVTVRNQYTNASVLDDSNYPSEIKLTRIKIDTDKKDDCYYIELEPEDFKENVDYDNYYKVQIKGACPF